MRRKAFRLPFTHLSVALQSDTKDPTSTQQGLDALRDNRKVLADAIGELSGPSARRYWIAALVGGTLAVVTLIAAVLMNLKQANGSDAILQLVLQAIGVVIAAAAAGAVARAVIKPGASFAQSANTVWLEAQQVQRGVGGLIVNLRKAQEDCADSRVEVSHYHLNSAIGQTYHLAAQCVDQAFVLSQAARRNPSQAALDHHILSARTVRETELRIRAEQGEDAIAIPPALLLGETRYGEDYLAEFLGAVGDSATVVPTAIGTTPSPESGGS